MKQKRRFLMLGIMLVAIFALTGCGKTTVKLDKYITINAAGYDSMGSASYMFDYDAFKKDYSGKIKLNSENSSNELINLGLLMGATTEELFLSTCVNQQLDKTSGLSNGDIVTLKWNCEEAMAEEYFNVTLKYSDIEYKVTGLEEVGRFNPFDYVEVSFSGISPNGSVVISPNYDQKEIQYVNFSVDKNNGLKNGDTVTVTASVTGALDNFVENFGMILGVTEQIYTVDALSHYATEVNEIPTDMMDEMVKQGEDAFRSYVAKSWNKPENLVSVNLAGNYFLSTKAGMFNNTSNYLYLVYEIQAVNPEPQQTVDFYYYVCFNNIVILEDGTCSVDLSNYTVPVSNWYSSESFSVGNFVYIGYENLETLFNNCVVSKIETYEYSTTLK